MATRLEFDEACKRECLFYKLLDALDELGWYRLGIGAWIKSRRIRLNGFQEVALRILVWNGIVGESSRIHGSPLHEVEHRGKLFQFIFGKGGVKADAAYYQTPRCSGRCVTREQLIERLPPRPIPLIVVDMTQLPLHNLDEAGSLRRQLAASLGVIREYLWDRHMLLTAAPDGTRGWLYSFMRSPFVQITPLPTDEALETLGYDGKVILLDPSAPERLTPEDVMQAEAFILGGIVDKRPRPGATATLPVKRAERRRIELRGSLIGVPNTLNSLIEAVLRARYLYNGDIERALYDVIPPHEARIRAYVEITRAAKKRGCVDWSLYEELRTWLPLRPRDFEKAARMASVPLCEKREEISKDQFHHVSQR